MVGCEHSAASSPEPRHGVLGHRAGAQPVRDAPRQASGHIEALLHLAWHQQPAIKAGDHGLAADR